MPKHHEVIINAFRSEIEMATLPCNLVEAELALCELIFGNKFSLKNTTLEVLLENSKPQVHVAVVLGNITRIERGETGCQRQNITPTIGRLIEDLDKERIDIAKALGYSVKSIFEKYGKSEINDVTTTNQYLHTIKQIYGPKDIETRYVTEDVPFGLVVISRLGKIVGKEPVLHNSGIQLFSSLYGRDFLNMNNLIHELDIGSLLP